MKYNIVKKILYISLTTTIFSCSFFTKSQVISNEEFYKMLNTQFDNVQDVLNLFPKSVADVEKRVELIMKCSEDQIDKIIKILKNHRTYDNTVRALDFASMEFGIISSSLSSFELVCPDEKIRTACRDAGVKLQQFAIDLFSSNVELYRAIKEYADGLHFDTICSANHSGRASSEEVANCSSRDTLSVNHKDRSPLIPSATQSVVYRGKEKLGHEEKYFLTETIKDFERQGLNLSKEKLEEVKKLKKEIAKLSSDFSANIAKDKSQILVDRSELDGLKDDFIENLKKEGDKFILGCDYPTYFEVMQNCKVSLTRKKLNKTFKRRAYPINEEILNEVISKRDQLAKLLGFDSYSSLDLDDQMVKTTIRANKFLTDLALKAQKKELKEFEPLSKNLPDGVELTKSSKFNHWDYFFVKEQYKKKHFNVDENEIAEYFPVQKTIDGIFDIYQQFLDLEFKEIECSALWHEDVKLVEVYDKKKDLPLGYLFLDLYPRDDKYSHACMSDIVPSMWRKDLKTGEYKSIPAVILVVANFPKATKNKPALLKHNDVETFFHEFGHAMHGFLGKTKIASFSGTETKVDFVEMPSQMFEEWMWDYDMLKLVSSHYKTGQSLPDELINKKIALKKFDSGFFVVRQCWLALMSLNYFLSGENKDTDKIKKELYEKLITTVEFDEEDKMQTAFGHLIGYGAKYYSYLWSKVFALDLFEQIKKAGLLNEKEGRKLIDDVLGKGGSVEPDKLLRNFLGRDPNREAFLKDLGL